YQHLSRTCEQVFVVALSMGASLAMLLATHHSEISAMVVYSTPYWIRSKLVHRTAVFLDRTGLWPWVSPWVTDPLPKPPSSQEIYPRFAYNVYPLPALRELFRLVEKSKQILGQVRVPLLLFHSRADTVAPFASLAAIRARLKGSYVETVE